MHAVGRILRILRYPVKSMGSEGLDQAHLGWHGLDGDRRFAFRRTGDASGFPWLTATRLPQLVSYRPVSVGAVSVGAGPPTRSAIHVVTPTGETLALEDPRLRQQVAAACGREVELMHLQQGIFDEASLSLISSQTVARLGREAGLELDVRRFRPNLVIEMFDGEPFIEDRWLGQRLRFGAEADAPGMWITQHDARCAMINLDPDSAVPDARVLKAVARKRENLAGVYGIPVKTGSIRTGQTVFVVPSNRADQPGIRG